MWQISQKVLKLDSTCRLTSCTFLIFVTHYVNVHAAGKLKYLITQRKAKRDVDVVYINKQKINMGLTPSAGTRILFYFFFCLNEELKQSYVIKGQCI